jgi:hypothetical protein
VATGVAFVALAIASAPTGQQMTDAMYAAFGDNHSRAVHAKGTMVEGTFTPDPAARALSKAKLFTLPTAKVLGRFRISPAFRPSPTTSRVPARAAWP